MSFLSSILPIAGTAVGGFFGGPVGAAIGGSIGGALGGATAKTEGGNKAIDTQNRMFQQTQANLAPWMTTGQQANTALAGYSGVGPNGFNPNAPGVKPFGMDDFMQDPSYKWRLNQGLDAVLNKRSAMGGVFSGGTIKALSDYGQGSASQEYGAAYKRYNDSIDSVYRRLTGLSSLGENAAANVGNNGLQTGQGIAQTQASIGDVQGNAAIGIGNGITGGINNWLLAQALQSGQVPSNAPNGGYTSGFQLSPPTDGYGSLGAP